MENEESGKSFVVQWNNSEGGLSEGPLSVLWNLIESYKVDIFDVSLSRITRDFLSFLRISETLSLELSAEYALMAANLIYLKSKALLPDPGFEEEDYEPPLPPELVEKLLEHKKFQLTAKRLSDIDLTQAGVFRRESNVTLDDDENWLDVSLLELISAFNEILESKTDEAEIPALLTAPHRFTVEEKMEKILASLREKKEVTFLELFEKEHPEKAEIVATFLALLELSKQRILRAKQHKLFGEIRLFLIEAQWNGTEQHSKD
ncbi:segregation and condensation protein A [Leptospira adleri]|uniref:Segregation and condensation protein A n=1 Tax=Leptospira adleri TaxID=2023186 RepID=A0A2M9YNG3_9LEPT|nr:segregation/condensation protein A [Leptospira adleri]PJZ53088.1 ribulose phosphate epimerase [Leptospira adleri]PJZ62122.1 ribulose phosphate epimerase [Leptospira adleri]TGM61639.1 ribulose phosphate epimerase [Leptospira adleri]